MTPGPIQVTQRSFDDLGTALSDVTFCVIDLETTGANSATSQITEIAAAAFRAGQCTSTFQTLVDPQCPIPLSITLLTGIDQAMVAGAPVIDDVLGPLIDFIGDSVVVGHNVRFDLGFIREALRRAGRESLANRHVDTLGLARRLIRDEVPNCKLGTLASHMRLDHQPSHRALDDVMATADLLHLLIDRASGLGVTGLDDLVALPKIAGHPQSRKLALTTDLPRTPGVYMFNNRAGDVLYVGKATNLRSRVRSYFSSDTRKKVGSLLNETHSIDHITCDHPLEAAVREIRLIHQLSPHYNRQSNTWSRYVYVRLAPSEPLPKMSVVRAARDDGCGYLGPLPSTNFARRVIDAINSVFVTQRLTGGADVDGDTGVDALFRSAGSSVAGPAWDQIGTQPEVLLEPLRSRMTSLAADERFEEAAEVRERAAALASALERQRQIAALQRSGRIVIEIPDQGGAEIHYGRLVRTWDLSGNGKLEDRGPDTTAADQGLSGFAAGTVERESVDEVLCIARWLDANASTIRLTHSDHGLCVRAPRIDRFIPSLG